MGGTRAFGGGYGEIRRRFVHDRKRKSMYSVNSSQSNTMGGNGGAEDVKRVQGIARGEQMQGVICGIRNVCYLSCAMLIWSVVSAPILFLPVKPQRLCIRR